MSGASLVKGGSERHERTNGTIYFGCNPAGTSVGGTSTSGRHHADAGAFWVLPPGRFAAAASGMANTFVCTTLASPVTFCEELHDQKDRTPLVFSKSLLARHDVIYAEGAPCETEMKGDESAVN